ncbi:MAG: vanadium-dependent haloperoxidase [Dermatophilaceae bacterium]
MRSATQFEPPRPPTLTSADYTRDFNEVKAYGSATSTALSPEQTATALFFSGNALVQFNATLRDQATVRNLDIAQSARMFAAADMSTADALITVWHAKYVYGLWRPITAVNLADTDGNPATTADPGWVPLVTTPPYPEYPSGYNSVTATTTGALEELFHTGQLNLTLISTAVPNVSRHYDTGSALRADVVDARVWLGFHFRFADLASRNLGLRLSDWTITHYFQRIHHD